MPPKVLVAAHDPGGALAIAPLLRLLFEQPWRVVPYLSSLASARVPQDSQHVPNPLATMVTPEWAESTLKSHAPSVVLTGTSWNSNAEQMIRNAAHKLGIPSVVVLDYWKNFSSRWRESNYLISAGVDHVCVPSDAVAHEMTLEGFDQRRIHVTGNPHLDELTTRHKGQPRQPNTRAHPMKFLFLAEPLIDHSDPNNRPIDPLSLFLSGLNGWCETHQTTAQVDIKLHPKQASKGASPPTKFGLVRALAPPKNLILPQDFSSYDLVAGHQSTGLFECAAMGVPALAIPSLKPNAALLSAFADFGIPVIDLFGADTTSEIQPNVIEHALQRPKMPYKSRGSAKTILALIRSLAQGFSPAD